MQWSNSSFNGILYGFEPQYMLKVTADRRTELSNLRKGDSTQV